MLSLWQSAKKVKSQRYEIFTNLKIIFLIHGPVAVSYLVHFLQLLRNNFQLHDMGSACKIGNKYDRLLATHSISIKL